MLSSGKLRAAQSAFAQEPITVLQSCASLTYRKGRVEIGDGQSIAWGKMSPSCRGPGSRVSKSSCASPPPPALSPPQWQLPVANPDADLTTQMQPTVGPDDDVKVCVAGVINEARHPVDRRPSMPEVDDRRGPTARATPTPRGIPVTAAAPCGIRFRSGSPRAGRARGREGS